MFLSVYSSQNRQIRQVVMGKIVAPDSFGEISVLLQEAMVNILSDDYLLHLYL